MLILVSVSSVGQIGEERRWKSQTVPDMFPCRGLMKRVARSCFAEAKGRRGSMGEGSLWHVDPVILQSWIVPTEVRRGAVWGGGLLPP
ncbi:hypothetical protein AS203_01235 [Hoylesella enoeca]|uniref:Uncharacterized protein n=1 Tax=Hoylesella enoeca TaxID=76123 RepID=A0A0S2KHU5_9BACT|nr:hypothetical protein AS203_01235 [Hoylesella enoeca]